MAQRVIFHVDVNSAFLSWTAAYRVHVLGETLDLREVPSVIAGDKASRHSIILANSLLLEIPTLTVNPNSSKIL